MKSGQHSRQTLVWAAHIRSLRAEGHTLSAIGNALGIARSRVWQICQAFDIASPRDYGQKRFRTKATPHPIDPVKADRLTREKQQFWKLA